MGLLRHAIIVIAAITFPANPSAAKVIKFEILKVESPAFEGRTFGAVGTYDRIVARATIAVAPDDTHNKIIVDLDRAPRNAQGQVEATTDVEILRPTVAANGNRALFYEVLNRGSKLGFALFNDLPALTNDLAKATDGGNGFLMNHGYTVVWSGWQGDIVPGGGRMTFSPPIVAGVSGLAREDFIFDHTDNPAVGTLSYPAADLDPSHARISVREREADQRATPSGLAVSFESPTKISIKRPEGFDAGAIYEFIYTAKDPKVMGLGFAATRDVVSFLRNDTADASGAANPLAGRIDRAIGFGLSQSGRYLHDYLYLGFNADEAGRPVFEGLMPHISGGKKTFTNYRFSQPGRSPYEHADMLYPGADFPFTYPVITDSITGKSDGFLARCLAAGNCPKIIKTDSELEFYQQRASLVTTDTKGDPITMPDNVRLFLLSNLQHYSLAQDKSQMVKVCANPTNPLNAGPPVRALLVAMTEWIGKGTLPPESRYPNRADGSLAPPSADKVGFPLVRGFSYPSRIAQPTVLNFDDMPPSKGPAYPVFVPKTDTDGRDIAGVHLPTLDAPAGTYTGWNLRKAGFGEGELCDNNGTMIPFAATKEERLKNNDPRLSMAERYPNEGDRAAAIAKATQQLIRDRFLLEEDAGVFIAKPD
ncbi:MAG TPA: alpha/beta hydrolase domain-containing protein [Bradyrhizobium sp.]|uniref:alpha/beta hydrolase domain-containing protein n=1 Tax=Bradyrhizobium sp. TaxID=376 RepID=UPI002D7E8FB7|nr:alpha/beta hydrolase domain-containing protein [Bradyrhizobium sp.]HET7889120.1 alpha/beta hydrolase domain-containing protein [Bradyrhizobium sp.]